MKKQVLPPAHHRALSVVARSIERSLNDMSERIAQKNPESVLHRIERSYTPQQREAILAAIAEVRKTLTEFVSGFDLSPSSVSEAQIVSAHCAILWTLLEDSQLDKLRRYGEVPDEIRKPLERAVGKLLECVERLQKMSS